MKNVISKIALTISTFALTSACGTELDKSYEKEKNKRKAAEQVSAQAQEENTLIQNTIKNLASTENYIWIWSFGSTSSQMSLTEADAYCQSLGFALPVIAMVSEAEEHEHLGQELFSQGGPLFKVKDSPSEQTGITTCVKSKAG